MIIDCVRAYDTATVCKASLSLSPRHGTRCRSHGRVGGKAYMELDDTVRSVGTANEPLILAGEF